MNEDEEEEDEDDHVEPTSFSVPRNVTQEEDEDDDLSNYDEEEEIEEIVRYALFTSAND